MVSCEAGHTASSMSEGTLGQIRTCLIGQLWVLACSKQKLALCNTFSSFRGNQSPPTVNQSRQPTHMKQIRTAQLQVPQQLGL